MHIKLLRHYKMIHHILLYKFKNGINRIDEHLKVISKFKNNTEGLLDLKCGRNISYDSSKEFTHGFIMFFKNKESLDKYTQSEAHSKLVNLFNEDIEDKKVINFEDVKL